MITDGTPDNPHPDHQFVDMVPQVAFLALAGCAQDSAGPLFAEEPLDAPQA